MRIRDGGLVSQAVGLGRLGVVGRVYMTFYVYVYCNVWDFCTFPESHMFGRSNETLPLTLSLNRVWATSHAFVARSA